MSKILRRRQVEEITGLSYRTFLRQEQEGSFPERVRLGVNSVGWIEAEVQDWIENRQRGGGTTPYAAIKARG